MRGTGVGIRAVRGIMLAASALLLLRLGWVSIGRGTAYASRAVDQRSVDAPIGQARGTIFDRNMMPLAGGKAWDDQPTVRLGAVFPSLVSGPGEAIAELERVVPRARDGSPRVVRIPEADWNRFVGLAQRLTGVAPLSVAGRYKGTAEHVVGYLSRAVSAAGTGTGMGVGVGAGIVAGVDGIERSYDWALAGPGREVVRMMRDADGRALPGLGARAVTVGGNGGWVRLSIDSQLQRIAEEAFDRNAPHMAGAVVAMNPWTGEVLAMVSRPAYSQDDIASAMRSAGGPLINRAIRPYYPGSIFKVVVGASALASGVREPGSIYHDSGAIEAGGHKFRCCTYDRGGHGDISFTDAMAQSCNTAFIDAAHSVGERLLVETARAMGIGDTAAAAAVRLPFALAGRLPVVRAAATVDPKVGGTNDWPGLSAELANLALGQAVVEMTPLEAATMISVIANGGWMRTPTLVLEACGPDGRRTGQAARSGRQSEDSGNSWFDAVQAIPSSVAADLRRMLAGVVSVGTARAALGGLDAAGKTGTAQTGRIGADGETLYNAWFVGFAPVETARIALAVLVEGPESGGDAAAPIFGDICRTIMGAPWPLPGRGRTPP
ncbi:MAG: penicillin-binding transpeptidase domain-containing protein [Clostridia bacterium]|nr:penicillin-binding transpeptidase domain-containing protein [Clostridia bacterium]